MFFSKKRSISELKLNLSLTEARKRARILVIDNDEDAFPVKLLQNEGYNVVYWPKVESIRSLEEGEFDLIVLDIIGVSSPSMSKKDGFGVLEHLKKYNPSQIIVAYSGQSFDLSQQQFFKLADDFLGKPSDLLEIKQKVDNLLQNRFTALHYWSALVAVLKKNNIPEKKIEEFESLFVSNAEAGKGLSSETIITVLKVSKEVAGLILVLIGAISKFQATN